MSKIKGWIVDLLVKKYVVGFVAGLFGKIKGYKTQIGAASIVAIIAAKNLGFIPPEFQNIADEVLKVIYGATGISAGDKIRRYWEDAKKIGDEVVAK